MFYICKPIFYLAQAAGIKQTAKKRVDLAKALVRASEKSDRPAKAKAKAKAAATPPGGEVVA